MTQHSSTGSSDRRGAIAIVLVFAALAPSACGSDSASGGGSGGTDAAAGTGGSAAGGKSGAAGADASTTPPSKRSACRAYLTAACDRYVACGMPIDCKPLLDQCPDYLFAEGSTRTIDGTLACAQVWATHPCDKVALGIPPDCATGGTGQAGDPCRFAGQCQSLECTGTPDYCGICQRFPNPGEACDISIEVTCPSGQICSGGTCEPESPPPPPVSAGEACETDSQCPKGYFCIDAGTENRCLQPPAVGQTCGESVSGSLVYCQDTAYCNASYVCQPLPAIGQPCYYDRCAAGAYCRASDDVCVADLELGAVCDQTETSCAGDLECLCADSSCSTTKCLTVREEGESCGDPSAACATGTECKLGVCVALDSLGIFEQLCGG